MSDEMEMLESLNSENEMITCGQWVHIIDDVGQEFAGYDGIAVLVHENTVAVKIDYFTDNLEIDTCTCTFPQSDIVPLTDHEIREAELFNQIMTQFVKLYQALESRNYIGALRILFKGQFGP
ncbi:hypothetical protein LLE49_20240 [Alicyclobacillus tolerans]|uniref:hypothetical protein n=1 Tax=Alicyclobacillus tolerans TaxID=90970 RepID=UPI001F209B7E|nr:hypothetical protein [Alicyclobacillus tolerans]MCF8567055.1 hypothetical protein [Alicyclobacillus tolerans]